ncbi:MAG: hypothetical protein SFU99_14105 [Saprospiraceae bacterium]|nr:hypothetical protein [Saprospiraceae bacterium]
MKAPNPDAFAELVKVIADTTITLSQMIWEMFQEAKKDNPHLNKTLSKRQQARQPKFIPTEKTLEMTEQIMNLQELLDQLLNQFKKVLRVVSRVDVEWARLYHETLRPGTAHDPISRDIVERLDIIYEEIRRERDSGKSFFA